MEGRAQMSVREIFYNESYVKGEMEDEMFETFKNGYYGIPFVDTIVKTKFNNVLLTSVSLDPSWNEFEYFDVNYIYPLFSKYSFYSPTIAINAYMMAKNLPKDLNYWISENRKELLATEDKVWKLLQSTHAVK